MPELNKAFEATEEPIESPEDTSEASAIAEAPLEIPLVLGKFYQVNGVPGQYCGKSGFMYTFNTSTGTTEVQELTGVTQWL